MSSGTSAETGSSRRRLGSLALRINLWYAGISLALLAILFVVAERVTDATLAEQDREEIAEELAVHRARYRDAGLEALATTAQGRACAAERRFFVRVSTMTNRTIYLLRPSDDALFDAEAIRPEGMQPEIGAPRAPALEWQRVVAIDRTTWTIAATPLAPDRVLQVGVGDRARERTLDRLRTAFAGVTAVALVLAILGGWLLTRRGLEPIRALAATTRAVIRGSDLSARVPVRSTGDELEELGHLFNRMLARNESLVQGMREALDNVAHDLRTPLTRLRTSAEVALQSGEREALREGLADAVEESERLLVLLRALMDISEAEAGVMRLEREPVDLADVVRQVEELYSHVAEEAGVELSVEVDPGTIVIADCARLGQVVGNLVDNALKYTSAGGRVRVRLERAEGRAELRVADTGIGIAPEDQPRIWERLYRADPSRSQRGLGLGLSLVRAIVEAHGGSVSVQSAPGRGSTFVVSLPAER
ncbi:MAG: ATP-binding protein [Myxococcota bacterium]|nr:ATP-binding protein [Myxococcota bacterium]